MRMGQFQKKKSIHASPKLLMSFCLPHIIVELISARSSFVQNWVLHTLNILFCLTWGDNTGGKGWCPFFFLWPHCATCGILVPRPGIEPAPPAVEAHSLNHWTAREVPGVLFYKRIFIHFQCSQRSQIPCGWVSPAIYRQDHSNREEGFCPNKHMYKIMTYQKSLHWTSVMLPDIYLGTRHPLSPPQPVTAGHFMKPWNSTEKLQIGTLNKDN